ncbi:MAG: hypothetical protein ACOCWJ_06135, partial [Verrucomicrobiota bacterium]
EIAIPSPLTLAPGKEAEWELVIRAPTGKEVPPIDLPVVLSAGGHRSEKQLRLPLRPLVEIPVLDAGTAAHDLRDNGKTPALRAVAGDCDHGSLRLARRGDDLLLAVNFLDDRCSSSAVPEESPPQLEFFVDGLARSEPVQLVLRAGAAGEQPQVEFKRFGEDLDGSPAVDVASVPFDGGVRVTAAVPIAAFGLNANDNAFWFDAALVTARESEAPRFVSLFNSPRPFLDSRGYAKVLCTPSMEGLL